MSGTQEAPPPEALPTEIWATYHPGATRPDIKLHNKRGFALSSLRSADQSRYCDEHRLSELTRTWHDFGYRLYVLRPGEHWQDVSADFIGRGIPMACGWED